jgi:hypothetical protein
MNGSLIGDSPQWNIYVPGYLADGYSLFSIAQSNTGNFKLGYTAAYIVNESGSVITNATLTGTSTLSSLNKKSTAAVDDDEWLLFVIDSDAFAVGPYQFSCTVTGNTKTAYSVSATVEESVITTAAPSPYMNVSLAEDGSPIFDIYFPGALQFATGVQVATSSPTSSNFLYTSATADIDGVDVGSSTLFIVSSTFFNVNYKKILPVDSWLHVRIYTSVVTAGTYYLTVTFPSTNVFGRSTATAYASVGGIVASFSDSSVPSTSSWLLGSTPVPCGSDSELFILELDGSGTELDGYDVYVGTDYIFYMTDSNVTITAQILANQSLLINNFIVGIGKNYLSLVSLSTSFITATPWSIVDGYLKLYGSDFHAVPSGSGNNWVLGSINAAASRSDMREVKIKALGFDDNLLADYPNCGSSSSFSSRATLLSSSSTATSSYSSSSVGLTTSSSVSGYSEASSIAEDSSAFSLNSANSVLTSLSSATSSGLSSTSRSFASLSSYAVLTSTDSNTNFNPLSGSSSGSSSSSSTDIESVSVSPSVAVTSSTRTPTFIPSSEFSYIITQSAEISSVGGLSASTLSVPSASVSVSASVSSVSSIASEDLYPSSGSNSSRSIVYQSSHSNVSTVTTSQDDVSTTVVTITSCSSLACHSETVTTGVVIVTSTVFGEFTTYKTFCPLSSPTVSPLTSRVDVSSNTLHSTPTAGATSSTKPISQTVTIHGSEVASEAAHKSNRSLVYSGSLKADMTSTEHLKTTVTVTATSCSSNVCSIYLVTTSTVYSSSKTGLKSAESATITTISSGAALKTPTSVYSTSASISEFAGQGNRALGSGLFGLLLLGLII